MSEECKWLHERPEALPAIKYPFRLAQLPENGIYFFYEEGEFWGHGSNKARIVRVGTSKEGNFRKRIAEHFLLDESKMEFDASKPAPRERSIFRKNIGRALLGLRHDPYLTVWEIDFTSSLARARNAHLRDIEKEKALESEITRILRTNFCFKYLHFDKEQRCMGKAGIESALIGTLSRCPLCHASHNWLGKYSSKAQISFGKLWLVQHLSSPPISDADKRVIVNSIKEQTERKLNI
jgi:hypothetical protein